jgi:hypothetical protein
MLMLEQQRRNTHGNRYYDEHADETNHDGWQGEHVSYEEEKDFGRFEKEILCGQGFCRFSDSSSLEDPESESFENE